MKTISYVIQDPIGLHARPAGQLAKAAGAMERMRYQNHCW